MGKLKPLKFGLPGCGDGTISRIKGHVDGIEMYGSRLPDAISITASDDHKHLLPGNRLRFGNQIFWIAARRPAEAKPGQTNIELDLRIDKSTRQQRRKQ